MIKSLLLASAYAIRIVFWVILAAITLVLIGSAIMNVQEGESAATPLALLLLTASIWIVTIEYRDNPTVITLMAISVIILFLILYLGRNTRKK